MTFRRFMGFTAMAFLWTGSQIPVYLFGKKHLPNHAWVHSNCFQEEFLPISMDPSEEPIGGFGLYVHLLPDTRLHINRLIYRSSQTYSVLRQSVPLLDLCLI